MMRMKESLNYDNIHWVMVYFLKKASENLYDIENENVTEKDQDRDINQDYYLQIY